MGCAGSTCFKTRVTPQEQNGKPPSQNAHKDGAVHGCMQAASLADVEVRPDLREESKQSRGSDEGFGSEDEPKKESLGKTRSHENQPDQLSASDEKSQTSLMVEQPQGEQLHPADAPSLQADVEVRTDVKRNHAQDLDSKISNGEPPLNKLEQGVFEQADTNCGHGAEDEAVNQTNIDVAQSETDTTSAEMIKSGTDSTHALMNQVQADTETEHDTVEHITVGHGPGDETQIVARPTQAKLPEFDIDHMFENKREQNEVPDAPVSEKVEVKPTEVIFEQPEGGSAQAHNQDSQVESNAETDVNSQGGAEQGVTGTQEELGAEHTEDEDAILISAVHADSSRLKTRIELSVNWIKAAKLAYILFPQGLRKIFRAAFPMAFDDKCVPPWEDTEDFGRFIVHGGGFPGTFDIVKRLPRECRLTKPGSLKIRPQNGSKMARKDQRQQKKPMKSQKTESTATSPKKKSKDSVFVVQNVPPEVCEEFTKMTLPVTVRFFRGDDVNPEQELGYFEIFDVEEEQGLIWLRNSLWSAMDSVEKMGFLDKPMSFSVLHSSTRSGKIRPSLDNVSFNPSQLKSLKRIASGDLDSLDPTALMMLVSNVRFGDRKRALFPWSKTPTELEDPMVMLNPKFTPGDVIGHIGTNVRNVMAHSATFPDSQLEIAQKYMQVFIIRFKLEEDLTSYMEEALADPKEGWDAHSLFNAQMELLCELKEKAPDQAEFIEKLARLEKGLMEMGNVIAANRTALEEKVEEVIANNAALHDEANLKMEVKLQEIQRSIENLPKKSIQAEVNHMEATQIAQEIQKVLLEFNVYAEHEIGPMALPIVSGLVQTSLESPREQIGFAVLAKIEDEINRKVGKLLPKEWAAFQWMMLAGGETSTSLLEKRPFSEILTAEEIHAFEGWDPRQLYRLGDKALANLSSTIRVCPYIFTSKGGTKRFIPPKLSSLDVHLIDLDSKGNMLAQLFDSRVLTFPEDIENEDLGMRVVESAVAMINDYSGTIHEDQKWGMQVWIGKCQLTLTYTPTQFWHGSAKTIQSLGSIWKSQFRSLGTTVVQTWPFVGSGPLKMSLLQVKDVCVFSTRSNTTTSDMQKAVNIPGCNLVKRVAVRAKPNESVAVELTLASNSHVSTVFVAVGTSKALEDAKEIASNQDGRLGIGFNIPKNGGASSSLTTQLTAIQTIEKFEDSELGIELTTESGQLVMECERIFYPPQPPEDMMSVARNRAAVLVQSWYRGARVRKGLKQQAAATRIQARYKGYRARVERASRLALINAAATKIQARYRGHRARVAHVTRLANNAAVAEDEAQSTVYRKEFAQAQQVEQTEWFDRWDKASSHPELTFSDDDTTVSGVGGFYWTVGPKAPLQGIPYFDVEIRAVPEAGHCCAFYVGLTDTSHDFTTRAYDAVNGDKRMFIGKSIFGANKQGDVIRVVLDRTAQTATFLFNGEVALTLHQVTGTLAPAVMAYYRTTTLHLTQSGMLNATQKSD